ncbi:outer membrane protein [Phenylobacterium sp.]|jgi:outer membrane immunogenic protein|uniref:outer membrane protein n=1 Tax=Phenylobacterium sp. TaxID=1871053 RepID=UPI002E34F8BC|nr:outer membrane beta-barrel protein [Phenylobacterium sp.]HEX2558548.1 outer membrane beta-barrel protein [Phenylobacterium sp.]
MNHRISLAAAAAVAALTTTGASAQEVDWSGFYVGAHAGGGWMSENDDETVGFDTDLNGTFNDTVRTGAGANAFGPGFCGGAAVDSTAAGGCDEDEGGFEFGGHMGYDMQFGGFVFGALVEASRTDVEDSVTAFSTTPANYVQTRRLKNLVALRARGGFGFGRSLVYATGGVASGDVEHSFNTTNRANTFSVQGGDDRATGWQLGGGVEHMVTPEVALGLEYLYTTLDDEGGDVRAAGPAGTPFTTVNAAGTVFRRSESDFESHSVRVKASYRF